MDVSTIFGISGWLLWLILFIAFLAAETLTVGLTTIWFAGGALVALFVSLAVPNFWVQIAVFIVVSVVLLWAVRPFALKYMKPRKTETNYKES
ncbi:MAG: NfeD family protein, partial [Lachnospiraceae bacterium]|nr:NfeD family protein [Lachnospiraceae bacterium]